MDVRGISKVCFAVPLWTSQTIAQSSSEVVISSLESLENITFLTKSSWASSLWINSPVFLHHIMALLSIETVDIYFVSGENTTDITIS